MATVAAGGSRRIGSSHRLFGGPTFRRVACNASLVRKRLEVYSANAVKGDLLRNGITVSLLGAPNAGKSSLLNRIVGREAAIVSKEAGTTRDVVEVGLDIGGWYCRIGDMAGLRKATYKKYPAVDSHEQDEFQVGDVEREGIKRAKQRTMESDVVIVVLPVEKSSGQRVFDLQIDDEVVQTAVMSIERGSDVLVAVNKTDQIETLSPDTMDSWKAAVQQRIPSIAADQIICISCQPSNPDATDPGNIQAFLRGLMLSFENMTSPVKPDDSSVGADPSIWQESLGASERHRLLLSRGQTHLNEFLAQVTEAEKDDQGDSEANFDIVVAAESLRSAADCLGKITGKAESGDVEEVLGVVFEKYARHSLALSCLHIQVEAETRYIAGQRPSIIIFIPSTVLSNVLSSDPLEYHQSQPDNHPIFAHLISRPQPHNHNPITSY